MSILPIPCQWDGEAFRPRGGFAKVCDKHFVVGAVYSMGEHEDRSTASHRHFFAACNDAWASLPEHMADQFPTADHLRKFALIKAGFYDSRTLVASSRTEALRLAAFVKPMDEFAIVTTEGATVTVFTAKSQSTKAMGRQVFQDSKDKVLAILAELIGTTPSALSANAGQAA